MASKGISDEQIIAALLNCGTIRKAAAAVKLSERALYDRMSTSEFQALYKTAKADLIRAAVISINNHLQEAIATIADVMTDKENNAAVRLQAAQTILNNACKFSQRLQDDEESAITQAKDSRFSIW